MGIADTLRNTVWNFLLGSDMAAQGPAVQAQRARYELLRSYQRGDQRQQLKVKPLQSDDNVVVNFMGLIIERGISMLFGQGIEFDLPGEDETEQDRLIQDIWAANRQAITLHRLGQLGGLYGTGYLKILPVANPLPGKPAWRLMPLNPRWMQIATESHDMDQVLSYVQRYATFNGDAELGQGLTQLGRHQAHKIVTQAVKASESDAQGNVYQTDEIVAWTETHYILDKTTAGRWVQAGDVVDWPWPFAPIVSWQNLPDAESPYGLSDIEDIIGLQDRYNFIQSNNSKIVRYHAHPRTWGRGQMGNKASWGADEIIWLTGDHDEVKNLEMHSDLKASVELAHEMRQDLFDIARTVDSTLVHQRASMQLTNFGLRVLYKDALDKNYTKRELYGEALLETNRRLLLLSGYGDDVADPGSIVWPDPLPVEEFSQAQTVGLDIANGLVSKQTASGARGYEWEQEDERMQAEQKASDNVGAALLRAFGQGKGATSQPGGKPETELIPGLSAPGDGQPARGDTGKGGIK